MLSKQAVSHAIWARFSSNRRAKRHLQIVRDAKSARGQPNYLVLGDSNTQAATLLPTNGMIPVNAGIGGARVNSFLYADLGRRYVDACRPQITVIALGTNDAGRSSVTQFRDEYEKLLDRLSGTQFHLLRIPDTSRNETEPYNKMLDAVARSRDIGISSLLDLKGIGDDGRHYPPIASRRWAMELCRILESLSEP